MRRNKHLLLWTSLGTLLFLGWAAYQENFRQEWRLLQSAYRARLPADRRDAFAVQLRQIVIPSLGVADRCVSCHVGMAPGESGIAGDPVFSPHPDVRHDPAEFGCTVCHGGQGRATVAADAHGAVRHWPEPMIPKRFAFAGCGTCHTHLAVPNRAEYESGRAAFERRDCYACHRVDGRGGTLRPLGVGGMEGPDLSRAGALGFDRGWYAKHVAHRDAGETPWPAAFEPLSPADLDAIGVFLDARVGAPGLVEAKALFHSLGCRGCHKIGGVGGDDGPDLTREGQRDPGELDFSRVPGGRTLPAWFAEHFRAPARVVPGSAMPYLGLSDDRIDRLTYYLLSLRRSDVPERLWPRDRIRAERFGEREFATDGATIYGTFCAACHGPRGEGMRYPGMPAFPAVGNPDFLALAPDEFLRATVTHGRPGRRMPAWGHLEGGLRPAEIDAVVAFLRELGGVAAPEPDPEPARWVAADPKRGRAPYAAFCAGCHGPEGGGAEGPALANRVLLAGATDTYLVETVLRGRRGTSMEGFGRASTIRPALDRDDVLAIVAYLRTWEKTP